MKMIVSVLLFLIAVKPMDAAIVTLSETEYARIPPVVRLDPYESCIQQPDALYCDVQLDLVSDTPSELLQMIHDYSAQTGTHYNHTKLRYTDCVTQSCSEYYNNNKTAVDLRTTLEACLNNSLWETYQLKARVIEYSCNSHKKSLDIGVGDIFVAIICIIIVLVNLIASFWDYFYVNDKNSKVTGPQLLLCFSIARNWRKLMAPAGSGDPRLVRLLAIHGVRTLMTCLVIIGHSLMPWLLLCENPQYVEELFENPGIQIILNGPVAMQNFLVMSGLLFIYNVQIFAEKHEISWKLVPKLILLRWWRLTPPYALVLGLTATWLRYASSGPHWQETIGNEAQDCRQNWWLHLLYINNYFDHSRCMVESWYLAADMQLYCIGVGVYVLCRSTRMKKIMLSLLLVVGIVGPALHTYLQDLDAILILSPETIRTFLMEDAVFHTVYKRAHTNLAGYVIGLGIGYLVYHWQKSGLRSNKYENYRILYWGMLPLVFCLIYSGSMFYEHRPRDPPYIRAAYAALVKPIFSALVGTLLLGITMRFESFYRGIFEWRWWVYPSRLAYGAYLCHVSYVRFCTTRVTATLHVTFLRLVVSSCTTIAAAFTIALVLCILVEAPLVSVMKKMSTGITRKSSSSTLRTRK